MIDQLKKGKPDPNIARYAIAKAFDSRVAIGFEERASAMAANLADGITPDVVRAFRATRARRRRSAPTSRRTLFGRMEKVYGKVLPGYGTLDPHGDLLRDRPREAARRRTRTTCTPRSARTRRSTALYPRDFWIPAKL